MSTVFKREPPKEGVAYWILQTLFHALQTDFADEALVLSNPKNREVLTQSTRIIFLEDGDNTWIESAGGFEKRAYSFSVGVIAGDHSVSNARQIAHQDYQRARQIIRQTLTPLMQSWGVHLLRQQHIAYRLENVDVGSGLVIGSWRAEYREPA